MKAIIWTKYGLPDVLLLKEVKKPVPKNDEVLIKIYATAVTTGDCRLRGFRIPIGFWLPTRLVFGFIKPRKTIPGMDISGEIEAVGKDVKLFKKGDKIYGSTGMSLGANAQYVSLCEKKAIVTKPNNISYEEAAIIPFGGLTAIHFLRDKANIQSEQKILINGASGAVGTASIQLAKYYKAEVTGVCSTANIELVKSLGADKIVDYTKEDFTNNGETYDIILDTVGNLSLSSCKDSLKKQGKLILINAGLFDNLMSIGNSRVICGVAGEKKEDLIFLKELVERGDMKPVIDRIYPLEQIVDAHRYVDKGHKKGNVAITVEHENL
jgi:NADPH:quinone reductase-like Zn-dependent oxidoreductase